VLFFACVNVSFMCCGARECGCVWSCVCLCVACVLRIVCVWCVSVIFMIGVCIWSLCNLVCLVCFVRENL